MCRRATSTRVQKTLGAREVAHAADIERLDQKKDKTVRDMETAQQYMTLMKVRAPSDGIFNILPNFRAGGSFGQSPPPFKEGDRAWTGAAIAEIPDLSEMRIELMLEEVDRGKLKLGQPMMIRVDAIPEKEFRANLDWISPIASLVFRTYPPEKLFPGAGHAKESGSADASRNERVGADHCGAPAGRAVDSDQGELSAEWQARGLHPGGSELQPREIFRWAAGATKTSSSPVD